MAQKLSTIALVNGFRFLKNRFQTNYIDQRVIEFLQRFRRLFASSGTNVYIATSDGQFRSWEIIRQKIWPLVSDNICGFLLGSSQLGRLRQFSPAILRNCPNLRSINSFDLFPEFPAEDNAEASSGQVVAKWLLTPRGDGLPKMLNCPLHSTGIEGLKRSFRDASESVNFIISIWHLSTYVIVPFELNNDLTGEQLTFRQIDKDNWLLVRCPIRREEDKWAKWEKEAIQWSWYRQWNRIDITFSDRDIGDGMEQWEDMKQYKEQWENMKQYKEQLEDMKQ
uniref:Uncharacterized protein n=1 Tax=Globodera pallida TaxID=36090 RepID=A0A183CAN4_GLOPA